MTSPANPENIKENYEELSKEELLDKVRFWEGQFHVVDGKYNELNKKLDAEIALRVEKEAPPCENEEVAKQPVEANEIQKLKQENEEMRNLVNQALQGLKSITEVVHSSSQFVNNERVESIDQYLRRNSLLWRGLEIPAKYGIDFIKHMVELINKLFPNLPEAVQLHHIDDAHPLKTSNEGTLVITKFSCRWIKNEIYKARATLKQTNISVFEQLTKNTQSLLQNVRSMVGKDTKVYTNNCVINFKYNQRKYYVKTFKDIEYVSRKIGRKPVCQTGRQFTPYHVDVVPQFNPIPTNANTMYINDNPDNSSLYATYYDSYTQPPPCNPPRAQGWPTNRGRGRGSVSRY